jgi:hypothetical protein
MCPLFSYFEVEEDFLLKLQDQLYKGAQWLSI